MNTVNDFEIDLFISVSHQTYIRLKSIVISNFVICSYIHIYNHYQFTIYLYIIFNSDN